MASMSSLIRLFRRETVSTQFIPVVDGLRFIAIAMVVLFHINVFISDRSNTLGITPESQLVSIAPFWKLHQGVQLFFVISGFILALPFMRYSFDLSDRKM